MIRLTRRGLGAVALLLAAVRPAGAAELDKLLPADSETVISVNARQIVESEIVKRFALPNIKQALAGNDAQAGLKAMGIDPLKDIDRVVVGLFGNDPQSMKGLVIVHGTFNPDKLYAAADAAAADPKSKDKVSLVKEGDTTLLKIQPDKSPNPVFGTVVDKNTVVFGSEKAGVLDALAVAGGTKKGGVKKDLAALVTKMDEKSSLFIAGLVAGKLNNVPIPGANDPALAKALEKMENMTLTLNVTGDVAMNITLGMKDAEAADDFGKKIEEGLEQAKGFIPLLGAQNPQLKPLAELGKTLKSGVKDKDITVSASLSGAAIAKMVGAGEE